MADEFGMKVWFEGQWKNLDKSKREAQRELGSIDTNIGKEVPKQFEQTAKDFGDEVSKISESFSDKISETMSSVGGVSGDIPDTGGGMMAGANKAMLAGAAITAALGSIVVVLKSINNRIDKMIDKMSEASMEFRGSKDLMDKMWNLALRPMGNLMATMMRPYLVMAMNFMKPRLAEMQAVLAETGGEPTKEDIGRIEEIWKGTAEGLGSIFQDAWQIVKPIAGQMEGFQTSIDAIFNTWLDGIGSWLKGLTAGFKNVFSAMPDSLGNFIMDSIKENPQYLEDLPENTASKFMMWIGSDPSRIEDLSKEIGELMYSWVLNNPSNLVALPQDTRELFFRWLQTGTGESELKDLPGDVKEELLGEIIRSGNWEELAKLPGAVGGAYDKYMTSPIVQQAMEASLIEAGENLGDNVDTSLSSMWETIKTSVDAGLTGFFYNVVEFIDSLIPKKVEPTTLPTHPVTGEPTYPITGGGLSYSDAVSRTKTPTVTFADTYVEPSTGLGYSSAYAPSDSYTQYPLEPTPYHQTGINYVDKEGLAYLHRGESVTNAPRTGTDNSKSITVNNTFNVKNSGSSNNDMDSDIRRASRLTEFEMRRRGVM